MTIATHKSIRKSEYGDWQTNTDLSLSICQFLKQSGLRPQVVIEPTCGCGNFIVAALQTFDTIEDIYGMEIYKPYLDELGQRLSTDVRSKANVHLYHQNIFDFDFNSIKQHLDGREVLILGNLPWVTNSMLGGIGSRNLPKKSNFKKAKGLDAITGKGNFDVAEYICYQLIDVFSTQHATLALLIKNAVVKSIVYEQRVSKRAVSCIEQYNIDAAKEFDVSVAASLFKASLGKTASSTCTVYDFYTKARRNEYGWVNDKFVSDINDYERTKGLDGTCAQKWRSGLKHDCAKVMELSLADGHYINGFHETVDIEDDCVYPLLKSSQIKGDTITDTSRYVIVTQHFTSDETSAFMLKYPKAYRYLCAHADMLDGRKSSIYKNRPRFCMFGIGTYSFKKYKIAISGLYKHAHFSLVIPIKGKPVMLDDTCYMLGFDDVSCAKVSMKILNSDLVQDFIHSLMFNDAKRVINKELLMRIDMMKAFQLLDKSSLGISQHDYDAFLSFFESKKLPLQTELFAYV